MYSCNPTRHNSGQTENPTRHNSGHTENPTRHNSEHTEKETNTTEDRRHGTKSFYKSKQKSA